MLKPVIPLVLSILILPLGPVWAEDTPAGETNSAAPLATVEAAEPVPAPEPVVTTPTPDAAPPTPVVAEEPPKPEHSRILPVKIKPVQEGADGVSKAAPDIEHNDDAEGVDPDTLTLYTSQSDGSFGPELWNDVSRTEVLNGFNKLPVSRFSPVQRDLLLRALLTRAGVPASSEKSPKPDVFAARMGKLIEAGAFTEAMQLNERLESPASTEAAALAGMNAFLGNGQIAIACLEQKALPAEMKTDAPLWTHLDKFCQTYIKADGTGGDVAQSLMHAALAYTQSEHVAVPTQFEDLNNRSLVELLALAKSGALDRGKWSVNAAQKLTPSVVSFLLGTDPQSVNEKLSLLTVAVAHGIRTPDDLDAAYKEIATSPAGMSAPRGDWGVFVAGTAKFTSSSTLKSALKNAADFSPAAYTPFVDELSGLTPAAPLTPDDARFIINVFIAAQSDIPVAWVNFAYGTKFTEESGESALLKVWNGEPAPSEKEGNKSPAQGKLGKKKLSPEEAYALILKDFLSIEAPAKPGKLPTYDNFLSLTGSNNYVMPSDELTESLKRAAQAKHLGKTLLYGLQVLNGQKADQIHPAALLQVLKAYKTAGLSEETVSLAHEALAGLTKEKKEN